ncbi:MAG: T9SS type A sorting domain-containing protein, partial [Saprospiraceae bacterium]
INEFHYAQTGVDNNEFVEVAGPSGTNLTGSTILLYRPSDGKVYYTLALSGSIPNQSNGKGVLSFAFPSETIINGIGAICLVQGSAVMDFIAYGSSFLAVNDAAIGTTPVNIGITESDAGPNTVSIQRTGNGRLANTFAWTGPAASSAGSLNTGQTIAPRPANGPAPTVSYTDTPIGSGPCGITILRKWKATDNCGLMSAIKTQQIRINPAVLAEAEEADETESQQEPELKEIAGYELYQNVPNPFDHSTNITFSLPETMRARLSIFDVNGRLVDYIEQEFTKGLNELTIQASELNAQGVYYYKLDTPDWSATKRMVLIK